MHVFQLCMYFAVAVSCERSPQAAVSIFNRLSTLWCPVQLKDMVRQQAAHDVDPPLSETASYIKNEMSKEGYRHLLAVGMILQPVCRCYITPTEHLHAKFLSSDLAHAAIHQGVDVASSLGGAAPFFWYFGMLLWCATHNLMVSVTV